MEESLKPKISPGSELPGCSPSKVQTREAVEMAGSSSEDGIIDIEVGSNKEQISDPTFDPNIDAGYAWVICFACFLFNFCTWGMNSGFAIYFANYLNNGTFEGATKMDYSYIGGIAFGVGLFFSPVITIIQGKIGLHGCLIIGNCLEFIALMLASFSKHLWQLYLTQGLIQSFGLAFLSIPSVALMPQYFKKRRVLAGSLATAGSGVGGIVFNLGMQKVVDAKSVFWALRVQSIIAFVLAWVGIILARDKQKVKIQFSMFDKGVFKSAAFYLLGLFVITCMFGYVIVLYTLAQFTTSLGYTEQQGSIVSAMVQVGSCFGRPVVGLLSDRYGPTTVTTICYYIVGIFCLAMWIPARNFATVIVFALIQGAMMGAIYGMMAQLVARLFGLRKLNIVLANVWCLLGVAGLFSPVIGVKLKKGEGGFVDPTQYVNCSIFTGCSFLACGTTLLIIRGYIKARDKLLHESEDHKDSDYGDFTGITVPIRDVFLHCFSNDLQKV
ncbi:putative transporter MCH2 [Spathaspora sp. JA1]|nr:putative transporter MCH2 [Spathaspora sp. JA1]